MSFLAAVAGFFKFFDQVKWLIEKLEKTPMEKVNEVMAEVDSAFKRAEASNDTSEIEDILNR